MIHTLILIFICLFNNSFGDIFQNSHKKVNETYISQLINTLFDKNPRTFPRPSYEQSRTSYEYKKEESLDYDYNVIDENYGKHLENNAMCPTDKCVPFHLCNNQTINANGEGMIDVRFDREDSCHYLEVCCADELRIELMPGHTKYENQTNENCGYRYTNGLGLRIMEFEGEAQYGEFPWMVAILTDEKKIGDVINVFVCGGSLIHPHVVLTAAHCVYKKNVKYLKLRAGEWDTQTTNEIWPHQDRRVDSVIIHDSYYRGALYNDIALVVVNKEFNLIGNIRTICLPPQNYDTKDKTRCFASGWGKDLFGREGTYSVILRKVEVPIVDNKICQSKLRKTRLGKYFNLHYSFICAGGEKGKDTCKGDGGSPLVCPLSEQSHEYYQAGIVSWGIGCGENHVPGVYVSIAKFRLWIDSHILKLGYDNKYYIPDEKI